MLNECDSHFDANNSSEGREMHESLENAVEGKKIFTPSLVCCQQTKLSYSPSANQELMENFGLSVCLRPGSLECLQ